MADVEAVDGLHQAAHGFLQKIGIAEGVMAETLGHVGGQADVGAGQAMLAMDVAIMDAAHGHHLAGLAVAVIADELRHGPGIQRRTMAAQPGEMPDEHLDQLALGFPERGQQSAFFFGGQKIGGKDGGRGVKGNSNLWRLLTLAPLGFH